MKELNCVKSHLKSRFGFVKLFKEEKILFKIVKIKKKDLILKKYWHTRERKKYFLKRKSI